MNRRAFLKKSCLSLTAIAASGCLSSQVKANPSQPNVLMICIDDLNDMIGCMKGHPQVKTPNIDRLAEQGTLFINAHCQAPICGPSRASLMSGLRPSTTGIYGQIYDNKIRNASDATRKCTYLHEYFQQNGYMTMGIGKIFHHHVPRGTLDVSGGRKKGFGPMPEEAMNWKGKGTVTDWGAFPARDEQMPDYHTAKWTIDKLKQKHEKPFMLIAGFLRPHVPWHVPQKWFDMYPLDEIETPAYLPGDQDDVPEIGRRIAEVPMMPTAEWAKENDEWREIIQAYLACVTFVDHYVGEILDALENSDYGDNTIVVLWSDHGYHLGEKNRFAKHSIWERATRAPLIIRHPGGKGGQRCSKPVQMLDIYPTLLDLANLPANSQNEGHSLTPLLRYPEGDWPYAAVTTYGRNNHAVRTERYRYIHYEDGSEELYDHKSDDNEWHNLADKEGYEQVKARLKKYLPEKNVPWSPAAFLGVNEYFRKTSV
ncbi:Arylsulfatase [Anaerohalosphaera lusitana]|uniref:Arylsulfatase n=1 Tax=Anaerohalosphaera lusitana TaxID=1936003 RepID=A0A1U9NHJ2_9BACT|nr:sulfatase [Anaerohalosphaera lusitana]AQT67228.1 Arylsulfatase [Anaerohalosphaera lusitana]